MFFSCRPATRAPRGNGFFPVILWLALSGLSSQAASGDFDHRHSHWDALLKQHVVASADGGSRVDYTGLAARRDTLKTYLDSLSAVSPEDYARLGRDRKLAFLINAYNAYTVELILRHYPNLDSIRDIGGLFGNPWKIRFFRLLGRDRHLDDIEHGLIRAPGAFDEPRIHFAVNCAAADCPPLRAEAYVGERLDAQLREQTERFLENRAINRLEADGRRLRVTPLLDWYGKDFAIAGGVRAWLAGHGGRLGLSPEQRRDLAAGRIRIVFADYDWSLNDTAGSERRTSAGSRPDPSGSP